MLKMPRFAREMKRGEEADVAALLERAFKGPDEARLVEALRRSGDMAGEMVLPSDDGVVGYYALSRMRGPKGWLCLAPVAIDPDWQGRGHGRRFVGQLAAWAEASGEVVVVLGDVPFYERCGFSAARAVGLTSPYDIAHTLVAGGVGVLEGDLVYPKAFG
jgi:putative acetyltransferase